MAVQATETRLSQEKSALENQLHQAKAAGERATQLVEMEMQKEILSLKASLEAREVQQQLAITEALSAVEKERDSLKHLLSKPPWKNRYLRRRFRSSMSCA